MAQTPVQAPAQPNYGRYEAITDILAKDGQEALHGLEDAVSIAWSDHRKSVAVGGNQGNGLADKLYSAADKYIRERLFDNQILTGRLLNYMNGTISTILEGYKESLSKRFDSEKVVHVTDVLQLCGDVKERIFKEYQIDFQRELGLLKKDDLEPFSNYVIKIANECGVEVKKTDMPILSEAIRIYAQTVMPKFMATLQKKQKES